jgi:hypothetical protein
MSIKAKLPYVAAALLLIGSSLSGLAQTSKPTLDSYVSQSVAEIDDLHSATIGEWAIRHPGEILATPADKGDPRNAWKLNAPEQQDRKVEGRWCLRSTAEIDLAGGIHVRRTALFYQPLVELTYVKPLPPLPSETGDALRNHGCRLVKMLHEFEGVSDPQNFVETIAKQIPGKRLEEPGKFIEYARDGYWNPVCSFEKFGNPISYHHLFTRKPQVARPDDQPAVLLEWQWGTLEYGQPSSKTINPEAGQPWLAMRAAMLAGLPSAPTLAMLSFLAPEVGDPNEQPPFHCERQLIPVLRPWLDLAAHSAPEQRAAAILLADRVLGRLSNCEEFSDSGSYISPEDEKVQVQDKNTLEKDLQELGIRTERPARLGNEYYSGNLLADVLKLAPEGVVNELGHMAILDDRCQWSSNSDSADCDKIIKGGETFLTRFPEDEWTPSVHLILAEAYALTAVNPVEDYSATPEPTKTEWERKATAHYRAWYAKSTNERDRALVSQEIWAIEAGMEPWLMMPAELQQ